VSSDLLDSGIEIVLACGLTHEFALHPSQPFSQLAGANGFKDDLAVHDRNWKRAALPRKECLG
jgi:hypothetical protein